ncbi:hypothetical protein C7M61_003830 [Candidozyma pseudohaemuli]|uniref:Arrestin-like N-terminal domain-containing protein n=1 Tax=Candidozyma pseudohaemuli TaxID=418784 RepID=A0A2P7YM01_9ASCO|nr:hypothetical protein C7M61_003830 [[Candida] pseudohaemulonii]PSK36965.1 hypothetical protein C7M61_003830 [[Candida] pseudohaemulonii]
MEVRLDNQLALFRPGDWVTGEVVLKVSEPFEIKDIVVLLLGETESCNFQHDDNRRRMSGSTRFRLFELSHRVFPKTHNSTHNSDRYELDKGIHKFRFDLAFPATQVEARCVMQFDWNRLYLQTQLWRNTAELAPGSLTSTDLPPSFNTIFGMDSYAAVKYTVVASVGRPGKTAVGNVKKIELRFSPTLHSAVCSVQHLTEHGLFLPDWSRGGTLLQLQYDQSKRQDRSFFDKMFSSGSFTLPLDAVVEFKNSNMSRYAQGSTSRVLHQEDILSDVLRVKLVSPFSYKALKEALFGRYVIKLGQEAAVPRLVIRQVKITIIQHLRYSGYLEKEATHRIPLAKHTQYRKVDFSRFQRENYPGYEIFREIPKEHSFLAAPQTAYLYELPAEWLEYGLFTDEQSFVAPNIQCDYLLEFSIKVFSSAEQGKHYDVVCEAPILLVPPRHTDHEGGGPPAPSHGGPVRVAPSEAEPVRVAPLADAEEAPPSYQEVMQSS